MPGAHCCAAFATPHFYSIGAAVHNFVSYPGTLPLSARLVYAMKALLNPEVSIDLHATEIVVDSSIEQPMYSNVVESKR
jgi:hypothetical protein